MAECGKYEIIREGEDIILRVDCEGCPFFPSLEDEPRLMAMTMDMLAEAGTVTQLVFVQRRDFEYDEAQVIRRRTKSVERARPRPGASRPGDGGQRLS